MKVPAGEVAALEATIDALAAETQRPGDGCTLDLQRHLLHVLLIWLQRWYDATHTEPHEPDYPEMQMHRRFTEVLERDYARHHDAGPLRRRAGRAGAGAEQGAVARPPARRPRS